MTLPLAPGFTVPALRRAAGLEPDAQQPHRHGTGDLRHRPLPRRSRSIAGGPGPGQQCNTASLTYSPPGGELAPGIWALFPSEIGPYPSTGAPSVTASANDIRGHQGVRLDGQPVDR